MSKGLSQREKYKSLRREKVGGEDDDREVREERSGGRNFSQTVSDSAAERKVEEIEQRRHASRGVVKEMMSAMQPSGKSAIEDDGEDLCSLLYFTDSVYWVRFGEGNGFI